MAVNKDAKKLTSLSLAALKSSGHEVRAWFAVGVGKDFLFYIDKKVKQPRKFKEPLALKKLLNTLKIDAGQKVDKDSLVVAGTIQAAGEAYEMTVQVKANGGGKSTLKSMVKDAGFKKIVGNVDIVKEHGGTVGAADQQMDAAIKTEMKDKKISGVKVHTDASGEETIEVPENLRKALKVFKWWDTEGRADLARLKQGAVSADEDTLQTIYRRLKKFAKEGMYKLFADGIIWDGPLKKLRPTNFDLTKESLKTFLKQTQDALAGLQQSKNESDFEDLASELVSPIEEDAEEYGELEQIGKRLKLKEDQFIQFMDAGKGQLPLVKDLVSKFSNDDVKLLLKYVGSGNWDRLFLQLMLM